MTFENLYDLYLNKNVNASVFIHGEMHQGTLSSLFGEYKDFEITKMDCYAVGESVVIALILQG